MNKLCGIYRITCLVNSKIYIGQTGVSFHRRWLNEQYDLNKNICKSSKLQKAWNKYGKDNFIFEVIELIERNKELLCERETYWINFYNSVRHVLYIGRNGGYKYERSDHNYST